MNLTRDRLRSIGWAAVLLTCFTFTVILTFKVNAVKSQVRLTERKILAIKQDKLLLETEFETRANQQQLFFRHSGCPSAHSGHTRLSGFS